jgi:signal transduction histidine kinase/ActR/RegA family two-component response regulator
MPEASHTVEAAPDSSLLPAGMPAESQAFQLLDGFPSAAYVCDAEGLIVSFNQPMLQLAGRAPRLHDAADRFCASLELFQTDGTPIPPEASWIARALQSGNRQPAEEILLGRPDGQRITVLAHANPLFDETGGVVGAVSVLVDTGDTMGRRQVEDALSSIRDELTVQFADLQRLHEMSDRLSSMRELQPILDETLRTAAAIANADLGLLMLRDEEGDALGVAASLGFSEEGLAAVSSIRNPSGALGMCAQGGRRARVEDVETDAAFAAHRDAARKAGFRALHCTPLINAKGRPIGALSVYHRQPRRPSEREMDLVEVCASQATAFIENARLYDALREADRSKNEFLATLAHELRNPLAPIRNAVHVLQLVLHLNKARTEESKWALDVIERQMQQLSRLVDDLLDLARITSGKLELRKDRIALSEILQAAVEASSPLIDGFGHELVIDKPSEPLFLDGDLTRLAQVVSNLLNNAAKYTERGGLIRLIAERRGNEATIAVQDNGTGIPADMLPRIFDMFNQGGRGTDPAQNGLGIGLTLVRRLVEMHGGTVEAHSPGINQGSELTVRLPLAADAAPIEVEPPGQSDPAIPRSALRILVVDDNPDSADSLAALLAIPGNQVKVAYDGVDGLAMAEELRPDAALLDLRLPRMDGYEVAQRIREQPWGKAMVLIALTGWGQEEAKQLSKEVGFDQHLVKPVNPAELLELLASLHQSRTSVG